MNGFQFLKELAKFDAFINKPIDVFFLSSSNNENDIKNALEIKFCSGYLTKPLTVAKLKETIELKNKQEIHAIHNSKFTKKIAQNAYHKFKEMIILNNL